MEIQEIDQVKETFTAIFVLAFQYVDPTLKDHYLEVKYIDGKESVKKVEAQIRGIEEGRGRICMRPKGNTGTPLRIFQRDLLAFTNHPDWDKHMKLDTWLGIWVLRAKQCAQALRGSVLSICFATFLSCERRRGSCNSHLKPKVRTGPS